MQTMTLLVHATIGNYWFKQRVWCRHLDKHSLRGKRLSPLAVVLLVKTSQLCTKSTFRQSIEHSSIPPLDRSLTLGMTRQEMQHDLLFGAQDTTARETGRAQHGRVVERAYNSNEPVVNIVSGEMSSRGAISVMKQTVCSRKYRLDGVDREIGSRSCRQTIMLCIPQR